VPNSPLFVRCRHDCDYTVNSVCQTIHLDFIISLETCKLPREQAYEDEDGGREASTPGKPGV